jgi:opacity protein-like surface antigen
MRWHRLQNPVARAFDVRVHAMLLGLLLMACLPRTASAQASRSMELSAGYSFVRDPRTDLTFPRGWTAGAAVTINRWLSAVADVSGSRTTTPTIVEDLRFSVYAFMFGARASTRAGPFVEFGQVLVGAVRGSGTAFGVTTSNTRLGTQVGAGLDYPFSEKLAVRGEIDLRSIRGDDQGGAGTGREVRVVAAIVYRVF